MRSKVVYLLIAIISGSLFYFSFREISSGNELVRTEINFNSNWLFSFDENGANQQKINLPHTARIEPLVVNDQWQGDAWYTKEFDIQSLDDQKAFLEFEGVMHQADVWLNESHMITHLGGYLPFCIDLSDHLNVGKNTIKVKVNNEDNAIIPPGKPLSDLDFNYYGGIYRDVRLITTNKVYITDAMLADKPASGGLLVHFTEVSNDSAIGSVQLHVANETQSSKELYARIVLSDNTGNVIEKDSKTFSLSKSSQVEIPVSLKVNKPRLWSTIDPFLYQLKVELFADGQITDELSKKVGIRKIELTENGFFLNDKKLYIRGTNRHQEYPYVGYAISNNAHYRDAVKIKKAGFDFVRLSHYPQDDAFLDACDELGILVMNAIPGWQFYGDQEFVKNSYQDIRDMVRKDRNHPSVVFWEASLNESGMTEEYMVKANQILKEELPFDDTYSAGWIDHPSFDLYIPARQHGKAPDYWTDYDKNGRQIFIAEYGDWEYYAQNAGFNQAAFEGLKEEERTSRQLREFGERRLLQQALNFQEAANSNLQGENTIGDANWVMFDYNRGYADDLEASGISDIFRIPKFTYYFYQSQRPPGDILKTNRFNIGGPMVKIASYWQNNSSTDIKVYSNCEEVALYLNDSLIARKTVQTDQYSSHLTHPPFAFTLNKFMPGTVIAKGYINSKVVCEDIVATPENPESLVLEIDNDEVDLSTDLSDVLIVHARVVDAKGTLVSNDSSLVSFSLEQGNAELVGKNPVRVKAGIASILLKIDKHNSKISIRATSEGLSSDLLIIEYDQIE